MNTINNKRTPRGLSTKTPMALHRSLQRILNMGFRDEVTPEKLRALVYCASLIHRVLETGDLEKRIEKLEEQLLSKKE